MANVCEVVGSGQHISEILRDEKPVAVGRNSRLYRIITEGRLLAVKVLPQSAVMATEVGLMGRLSGHRFVASMRGLVESQDSIYLTTDFFPVSCKQMVDEMGPLSVADLKKLAIQMIQVLSLLHEWGYLHGNFTLDKVRFKGGAYALCSFSKARQFGDAEEFPTKLEYAAPEVLEQHRIQGPEIDVWSLGVCLYYLSCGSFPFAGDSAEQVLLSIQQGLQFPEAIESARLRDLLRKLLMYNPQDRIPLQEVLLHPFLTGGKLPRVRTQRASRCHTDSPASGEPIAPVSSDGSLAAIVVHRAPDSPTVSACSSSSDQSVSTTRRFRIPVGKVTLSLPSFLRPHGSSHSMQS